MRSIKVSDEVWDAIAKRGNFGETEDDVLRRVFKLPVVSEPVKAGRRGRGDKRYATKRMHAGVEHEHLIVEFEDGARFEEKLPNPNDKEGIRAIREAAVRFALDHSASDPGQTNAVRKALTDAGYYIVR